MPQRHHKNIRLDPRNYTGQLWYFLTQCTHRRIPYFRNDRIARWLIATLQNECARHSILPRAYCLMPDHLHLLLQATEPNTDLLRFMDIFKQKTTFQFQTRAGKPLWQISFYDHILRDTEALDAVAWYIWSNPVRAKLAENPFDYPDSGPPKSQWKASAPANPWSPPHPKPK